MTTPQEPTAWGPPPGAQQQWQPAGPARTDPRAIVALVLAIGSFVVVPLVPAVVALVLAKRSRRDIAASGGTLSGDGLAQAARVLAWVNVALSVLAIVALVAAFVLFAVVGFS